MVIESFWKHVSISDDNSCWEWKAGLVGMGYGKWRFKGKDIRAHRHAYQLAKGDIPEGMFVCHKCDNPRCCNPSHLFLGTPKENTADMLAKNRVGRMFGTCNPQAKLTDADVLQIRNRVANGEKQSELASEFGISRSTMCHIIQGKLWPKVGVSCR